MITLIEMESEKGAQKFNFRVTEILPIGKYQNTVRFDTLM